jgi:serine/threonine protein kinase
MSMDGKMLADRYAVGELLGRGGMAEVFLATDRILDRPVAVKVLGGWLADDRRFVERFRREALAAARISHPNLVAVFDAGSEGDIHFIVMEFVPGETLADVLRREGRVDPLLATQIASSVGDALATAHAAGIVHRDVKPANVMRTPDGRTKLMDLGIARGVEGDSITRASSILGTAGYVSPEQARGEPVDHRSDIYSLGCVLYEMLAGRQPFEADNPIAVAYQHVHDAPVPPSSLEPSVPPALESVVLRAMEKDPEARFPTAADMVRALDDGTAPLPAIGVTGRMRPLPSAPTTTPTATLTRRIDRPPPRRRMVPLLIAVVVLALLGGLAFALFGGDPPSGRNTAVESPSSSPSTSPSSSPSSSPSPSPTQPPADPVQDAVVALQSLVTEGLQDGTISEHAAEDIQKKVDDALEKYSAGDTEKAIEELEHLRDDVEEMVDHDEIANPVRQHLDKAIEDLEQQMFLAAHPEDD